MKFILSLCCLFVIACGSLQAEPVYPEIHSRVTDLSGTLSQSDVAALNEKLAAFERATSNQIVVLMIETLDGEDINDYTMRVAEKNKFGKKGRDNGVMLVIAKSEHKMWIATGYGLEGALPDAT